MKILLVENIDQRKRVNKDQMGGYGIDTEVGNSLLAKFISYSKKNKRNVPYMMFSYIASILSRNGHLVHIDNSVTMQYDLIIIASSIVEFNKEIHFARMTKSRYPKTKVGFIGPFAGFLTSEYLQVSDFVIKGEPESIVDKISNEWMPEGVIESKPYNNLDDLPFPRWNLFPIHKYAYNPVLTKKPFLPILSSRGCKFLCEYCPYKAFYGDWRIRSIGNIIEEIKYLIKNFNLKSMLFRDPLFTFNRQRVLSLAEEIIRNKFDLEWACETRLDLLDEQLIEIMYQSGLRAINVGIESVNYDILLGVNRKPYNFEKVERNLSRCERKGIKITAFYVLGFPEDTEKSIASTIEYAKKLNTFLGQFFIFTPFPGTNLYEKNKNLIYEKNWEKFNSFTPVFKHPSLSKERLLKLKERAFVSYYFRPAYGLKHFRKLFFSL